VGAGRFPWRTLPHTPGAEIVGVVEAAGPGAASVAPPVGTPIALAFRLFCGQCHYCLLGREEACIADPRGAIAPVAFGVTAPGGWAEYVLTPAKNCLPLPPGLAPDAACTAVVDGTTAWHMVDRARVAPEERVLVVGATGGVGLYALQIARQRGALVAAVAGGADKAAALRDFGADLVLDRTREDVAARARAWAGGRGADAGDASGASTAVQSRYSSHCSQKETPEGLTCPQCPQIRRTTAPRIASNGAVEANAGLIGAALPERAAMRADGGAR
jgi:NADPH:quinone reductase-like Zn-dependent oxidoreductase